MPSEPVKFPVDFEKLAKTPPAPGGAGYPYIISGKDMMDDYNAAALLVDDSAVGGLQLKETRENGKRTVVLSGEIEEGTGLPDGGAGDMLYHNGSGWTILPAPSSTGTFVLGTVDGSLQWMTTEEC